MIRVGPEDFDVGEILAMLATGPATGAVASFVGLVRDHGDARDVVAIELEHYPGMTEKALATIEMETRRRWPLDDCLIIHRIGLLPLGARIVIVAASSAHRAAAMEATSFLIDYLKTEAPFWKREIRADGTALWVEAKTRDKQAAQRWNITKNENYTNGLKK